jgi:iron complex transport system substrate-binding protein
MLRDMPRPVFKAPPFFCRQHPLLLLLLTALALFLAYAATTKAPARAAASPARNFVQPTRIISLAPALTEMLYAIDKGAQVVGVSAYSDFPAAAKSKPVVGDALHVDEERIIALRPDLILVAEGDKARLDRLRRLTHASVELLPTKHVSDIWSNLLALGALTGKVSRAAEVTHKLQQQVAAIAKPRQTPKKAVFYMVWDQPLMTAGKDSYLNDLIELAGGRNVAATSTQGSYPSFSWELLLAADPDVILGPANLATGLKDVAGRYPNLKAVRSGHVRALPDDVVSRPGPRVVLALAAVEAAMH